jgi:hypothetical protein
MIIISLILLGIGLILHIRLTEIAQAAMDIRQSNDRLVEMREEEMDLAKQIMGDQGYGGVGEA